jgi:hypothetical protein
VVEEVEEAFGQLKRLKGLKKATASLIMTSL